MSNKKTALIIDDEALARKRLKKLLVSYTDTLEIIGEATNGKEGLEHIKSLGPDLVFLDIQMPIMDGFEMLNNLTQAPFIVFTTAFDEYALKAFEENSIDYLLKPITVERLGKTMKKLEVMFASTPVEESNMPQLKNVLEHLNTPKKISSITITTGDQIIILKLTEVLYFLAEDKLTTVATKQGKEYYLSHSLNQLSPKLPNEFIRVNRSCILNENEVLDIRKGFGGKLTFTLNDTKKTKVLSGSTYTTAIKERWKF